MTHDQDSRPSLGYMGWSENDATPIYVYFMGTWLKKNWWFSGVPLFSQINPSHGYRMISGYPIHGEHRCFFADLATLWPPFPICSMYGIFTYIWVISRANVGKYSIHGAYGFIWPPKSTAAAAWRKSVKERAREPKSLSNPSRSTWAKQTEAWEKRPGELTVSPMENHHLIHGKSPFLFIGKSTINIYKSTISMAMFICLICQMVFRLEDHLT